MKKKLTALLLAALLSCAAPFTGYAGTISSTTSYTLKESSGTKTFTVEEEYKNLTITPRSADKPITLTTSSLDLSGGGSKNDLCISFNVTGPCRISVKFAGTNTDERTLVLEEGTSGQTASQTNSSNSESSASVLNYDYTGNGEKIYLYSKTKGLHLYSLSVTYPEVIKGDADFDGKITGSDARAVLKHLAGIAPVTAADVLNAMNANSSGNVDLLDAIWILNNLTPDVGGDVVIDTIDTSDGTEVSNFTELKSAFSKSNAKVYVMDDIECSDRLELSKGNQSLIGVPKSDGTLPSLNFENMTGKTSDIIHNASSDGDVGVRVNSANNVIKNLVIEHAHDNGIQIKGSGALYNTVENVIVRYNNDSGMQITGGAYGTTVKNVYSYRNCDVYTGGGNADGFAVKLSAGPETTTDASTFQDKGHTFENCFAWDNGDDGWDSFDYPESEQTSPVKWTYKISYKNCMCWNNGIPAVHLGYADYVNGLPLDEELPVMHHLRALVSDSVYQSFKTAYNNGTLGSRTMSVSDYYKAADNILNAAIPAGGSTYSFANYASKAWDGNPNGFKIGSKYTQKISERTFNKCIAFDHQAAGFDKNNSGCYIELTDTISFNNKYNYHFSGCTARIWENVMGWSLNGSNDWPTAASGVTVKQTTPASVTQTEAQIREAAQKVIDTAADNKFTATNIFDTVF